MGEITQAEIKRQIKEKEAQRQYHLKDVYWKDETYSRLKRLLEQRRKELYAEHYPISQQIYQEILTLKSDLEQMKKNNELKIPEHIQDWFKRYQRGMDYGYAGLKIRWISPDEEWVIITNGGTTTGTGTAMGTMGYYYAEAEHWVANTTDAYPADSMKNAYLRARGGRLTKDRKNKMINEIKKFNNGEIDSLGYYLELSDARI